MAGQSNTGASPYKHPYHLVDPSPWPLLSAFAGGALVLGIVFIAHNNSWWLAGLGLFAATGAQAALDHGLNAPMAAVLGMVSAIGGGIVRDVLMARVPVVLVSEIYAVAALAGSAVVVASAALGVPQAAGTAAGAVLCFFMRMMAIYRGWRLPVAARLGPAPTAGREGETQAAEKRKED